MIEAQQRYSASTAKGREFQFVHCWLKVRHCEKSISLHEAMKQAKRPSRSLTTSEGDGTTPGASNASCQAGSASWSETSKES
jgi:hypothetical protein